MNNSSGGSDSNERFERPEVNQELQNELPPPQKERPTKLIGIIAAIAIVAIIAVLLSISSKHAITKSTTTIISKPLGFTYLSSCSNITSSGRYVINKSIGVSAVSSCIIVKSPNVDITCDNNSISGKGPFQGVPPFTYGVYASNESNITISNCVIDNFSYGIYLNNVKSSKIYRDNLTNNYISNLALDGVNSSNISYNTLIKGVSAFGSLFMNRSYNNVFRNNTIRFSFIRSAYIDNSTGNLFLHNVFSSLNQSLYCSGVSRYAPSNKAEFNLCYNESYCNFISCGGVNKLFNITSLHLLSNIDSCGSIVSPGVYSISSNIDMLNYLTPEQVNSSHATCIYIKVSNVKIDCNNNSISNAYYAVYANSLSNISLENCKIDSSRYGLYLLNDSQFNGNNLQLSSNNISILSNHSYLHLTNITAYSNYVALLLNNSNSSFISNLNSFNNTYGLETINTHNMYIQNSNLENNTAFDIYASVNSANISSNLAYKVSCGFTNAYWATCKQHISPNLDFIPLKSCITITRPFNYSLLGSLIDNGSTCINIEASNVRLNCNNLYISSYKISGKPAIQIKNGLSNITIDGCNINDFRYGVNASNIRRLSIYNDNLSGLVYGANLNSITNLTVANSSFSNDRYGLFGYSISNADIYNNSFRYVNYSIILNKTYSSKVINNRGDRVVYGIIVNNSINNNITRNNFLVTSSYSYACYGNSSAVNSNLPGVDYGASKLNCIWMASLPYTNYTLTCQQFQAPQYYTLDSDNIYTYGAACFTADNVSNVDINCRGHTIIATNGGTFLSLFRSYNDTLQNCALVGFTKPIVNQSSSIRLINVTLYNASQIR
ncbi:MAG: hypothetical protein ARM1_0751 [Candidatus Micrarchaeota archaeon]|nr:MAG: hypothetical protein ARM1_0751 [Candidatus Micrarchaeota archaeon]